MPLQNKIFFAFTVKLLLCATLLKAQTAGDSLKQKPAVLFYSANNILAIKQTLTATQLPGNFYTKQLPFFCGKELQVQKVTGLPIKFRLSTVEYCDRLEGKYR